MQWLGVRRVKKCYTHFQDRIRNMGPDTVANARDLLQRVEQAVLVKIEVDSHADAFVLFESLNNRGMALTPIDLIKNSLLKQAYTRMGIDEAFDEWNELLADISEDYGAQERFFRHYYNAFKDELPPVQNAPVATRSNLIYIYETLIKADLNGTLQALREAGVDYQRIIGNTGDEHIPTILDKALLDLSRVQGAPSYILLLRLLGRRKQPLTENELAQVTEHLTSFFVRRNLTGYPQTYGLPRLFMSLATETLALPRDHVVAHVRETLRRESSPDEEFAARLTGPVYAESTDVARFILTSLAESAMTKETELDLWRMESKHYERVSRGLSG